MDEPIGALDAKLREEMRTEIKRLHLENDSTTIYVTHDQVEAMSLADRIAIMNEGVLQQVGTPDDVYSHPANLFVAQFVGSPVMNVARLGVSANRAAAHGRARRSGRRLCDFRPSCSAQARRTSRRTSELTLGIRPEGVLVAHQAADGYLPVEAHIIEPLGAYDIVDLKLGRQCFARARRAASSARPAIGLGQARPGADAFLRYQQRRVARTSRLEKGPWRISASKNVTKNFGPTPR